jgi:hypothetical protein
MPAVDDRGVRIAGGGRLPVSAADCTDCILGDCKFAGGANGLGESVCGVERGEGGWLIAAAGLMADRNEKGVCILLIRADILCSGPVLRSGPILLSGS